MASSPWASPCPRAGAGRAAGHQPQFRAGGRPPAGAHGLSGEQPGAGNFISCNIQRNLQDSFDMLILLQQIDYHQLAELRSGLELQAALLAVDRITDSQVDRLDSLVRQMTACPPEMGPSWTSSSTTRLPPFRAISSSFRFSGPCPPPSTGSSATCAAGSSRIPAPAISSSTPTSRWWTPCAAGTRPT